MFVLGIETSCDETACSVVSKEGVWSDIIWSQTIHSEYGGVVPEIASRAHLDKIVTCTEAALQEAGLDKPDAVAATAGPGLKGALLVGFCYGKALAMGWKVPFIGVNHLEAHLLSALLEDPAPAFPFLSLVVSGGHTSLYLARELGVYETLGQTIDDAAGEAYDKLSRMMGKGYPGGPIVDKLAHQGAASIPFPRPRPKGKGRSRVAPEDRRALDMSFSGLKTAARYYLEKTPSWSAEDVSASFQAAVIDVLLDRIERGAKETGVRRVVIGGGVAANSGLRAALQERDYELFLPPRSRCTDNGSMIAHCGLLHLQQQRRTPLSETVRARWTPGAA